MYENWKILKTELSEKQEEYAKAAEWCNENQQHTIEEIEGCYQVVKIPEPTVEEKQEQMRAVRNMYLEQFVDTVVSNPLRWADMSEELKQMYTDYRKYLLDYTEGENWWLEAPKTLKEWRDESIID